MTRFSCEGRSEPLIWLWSCWAADLFCWSSRVLYDAILWCASHHMPLKRAYVPGASLLIFWASFYYSPMHGCLSWVFELKTCWFNIFFRLVSFVLIRLSVGSWRRGACIGRCGLAFLCSSCKCCTAGEGIFLGLFCAVLPSLVTNGWLPWIFGLSG